MKITELLDSIDFNSNIRTNSECVSYEDALQKCGFGRFQMKTIFVGSLLILYVMNESMGMGYIMPASMCDLNLSTEEKGLLSGVMLIGEYEFRYCSTVTIIRIFMSKGIISSAYLWGYLGDTQGRRPVLFWCSLLACLFTIFSAFTNDLKNLMILRFFNGFL